MFSCLNHLRHSLLAISVLFQNLAYSDGGIPETVPEEQALFANIPSVYSASRHEQPVTQAPSSVSIVTDDDIKKYGYRTLADIISSLKGMYTSYDRVYHRAGIRGFNRPGDYNFRLLVLVDGHRTNDNIVDYSAIGTDFMLDLDDISRVELVRGPASSLYGSNAFFGVVNVITKRGRDLQAAALNGSAGSLNTYKGKFAYGDKFANGAEVYLSGSHYRSDGKEDIDVPPFGVAQNLDDVRNERGFGKISYADVTLTGGYVNRNKQLPIPLVSTEFNDSRTEFIDRHAYADIRYEHNFDATSGILARLYYDSIIFNGAYGSFNFFPGSFYKDRFDGQWWGTELQLNHTLFDHHITSGFEYRDNFQQQIRGFNVNPTFTEFTHVDVSRSNWALYLQDEYKLLDNLTLNLGLRYDKFSYIDGRFNPRAALIYQPFKDTTVKLIYGEAFRAPSVFNQYYAFFGVPVGNRHLKPETIETYEIVLEQQLTDNLEASISPYFYRVNNLIELPTASSSATYRNGSPIQAYGAEFELQGHWKNGWKSRFSYSYQQAENVSADQKLVNSPTHLIKFNAIAPLWDDKVFAGLELQYTSARRSLQASVPGYFLANATLFSEQLIKGVELSGTIYNLFDQRYNDPAGSDFVLDTIEQNGRTFRVTINYEF